MNSIDFHLASFQVKMLAPLLKQINVVASEDDQGVIFAQIRKGNFGGNVEARFIPAKYAKRVIAIMDEIAEEGKCIIFDSEFEIACQLREYMSLQYPKILMHMDLSGLKLPIGYAKKIKRLNPYRAWPDIFIAEPRRNHHGLFIELKRNHNDLYAKSGNYRQTQHIEEQRAMLLELQMNGYFAVFACGFEKAKQQIDDYLDRRL